MTIVKKEKKNRVFRLTKENNNSRHVSFHSNTEKRRNLVIRRNVILFPSCAVESEKEVAFNKLMTVRFMKEINEITIFWVYEASSNKTRIYCEVNTTEGGKRVNVLGHIDRMPINQGFYLNLTVNSTRVIVTLESKNKEHYGVYCLPIELPYTSPYTITGPVLSPHISPTQTVKLACYEKHLRH